MTWLRPDGDGAVLSLHIQPAAKKTEVAGLHGDALKIRLAAPPVDGKANDRLIAFLAERLGIAKSRLTLVAGVAARAKRVRVGGMDVAAVAAALVQKGVE